MMRVNLVGRHLAAPTRFQVVRRVVTAYALILLISAAASLIGLVRS